MLNNLYKIEKLLPELLMDHKRWNSLFIDYHAPIVERLWTDVGSLRVSLHRIHSCKIEEALYHKHPWPSAMRVVEGKYEMGVSHKVGDQAPVELAATLILPEGSAYEMTDPYGWHYVRPLSKTTLSLMVTGPPWMPGSTKSNLQLGLLTDLQRSKLFADFMKHFHG